MRSRHRPFALQPFVVVAILVLLVLSGCSGATGDGPAVGDDAPNFSLPEAFGSIVSLDDYAGEPALLYFHMADG